MKLNSKEMHVNFVHNPLRDRQRLLLNKHLRRRSKKSSRYFSITRGGFWEYWVTNSIYGYGKWFQVKKHGCLQASS